MTLEEKRQHRNKRCEQFLFKKIKDATNFFAVYRQGRDYTRMPAHQVHELAEYTGIDFNDLVSEYGFGSAVITFEVMDHYYHEMGNGTTIGQVQHA
jgi:hypothetical protein